MASVGVVLSPTLELSCHLIVDGSAFALSRLLHNGPLGREGTQEPKRLSSSAAGTDVPWSVQD